MFARSDRKNTEKIAEEALRKVGLHDGHSILDFGCGSGHYTIAAAKIAGERGVVYALDENERKLDEIREKVRNRALKNIKVLKSSSDPNIELGDNSIDFTLLFDIFWYFNLTDSRLPRLLSEVRRISKSDSVLSVYPKHVDSGRLKEIIMHAGFEFRNQYSGTLLHEGRPEEGKLLNFEIQFG